MTRDVNDKTSDLSQKIMDRILEEDKWVQPVHKQRVKSKKSIRTVLSIIVIAILLSISISFIFINPTSLIKNEYIINPTENIETSVKTLDFAEVFLGLDFLVVDKSVVTETGEPIIYVADDKEKENKQLSFLLVIFGGAILTLFLSWTNRSDDDTDYA